MKKKISLIVNTVLGNAMIAFGICAFVVPNDFMLGGTNGIALALQKFLPLPLSALTGILNLVLFLLGLICIGKEFAASSLLSSLVYPLIMAVFEQLPLGTLFTEDKLTCAIFFSLIAGFGMGIVIRSGGSTGGMDIPPCILQKYKGIPVGVSLMVFDTIIILAQVLLNGPDGILYGILITMLVSITVNRTVVTGEKKVQIVIISPMYEQIRQEILGPLDTGVTMVDIETGYEGASQKAVFCVAFTKKYPDIRDAVLKLDPKAFIVTTDVKNVNGKGYTLSRNADERSAPE